MTRKIEPMNARWRFYLGDIPGGESPDLDDSKWRLLELPHDWSIEGQFKENREENNTSHENLSHHIGYLPGGIGWYRKSFHAMNDFANKIITIQFDGVYRNSDVWINGYHLGQRPYGYSSFYYELTPYILAGKNNLLAVRVNNTGVGSRWYTGSGIYRNVQLLITDKIHIKPWGTCWTTPEIHPERVDVDFKVTIENRTGEKALTIDVVSEIIHQGDMVAKVTTPVTLKSTETKIEQQFQIDSPKLWSPDTPELYQIKTSLYRNGHLIDEYATPLGLRSFRFDADTGFYLNGVNMKFKGVCLHHDNGCLGAKVYRHAIERQLKILKEMGCNAVRTSHNPPSQEFLDLCDEKGFLVVDELFDEWTVPKTPFGYTRYFQDWYERDARDFVRRDRNHPSVILWSCGNEVPEQKTKEGVEILRGLLKVFHEEDPSRQVTLGCDKMKEANETGFTDLLDIAGYNYYGDRVIGEGNKDYAFRCRFDEEHEKYPNRVLLGTENCSAFNTRGIYRYPLVNSREEKKADDFYCSAYDVTSEVPLIILKTRPYVCGMFTWEGFDYIGEPTPYVWPARSSQFGILDLCGFPKDTFYLYQSQWTDAPMVHIVPGNWNWHKDMQIPVWVYTNCDSVELFLNGKSFGEKAVENPVGTLHLTWDVLYEPGELKAVGKRKGKAVTTNAMKTAQFPHSIEVKTDRTGINRNDIAYLTACIRDIGGTVVPTADNLVRFTIEGPGKIIGVDNGNPISHEPFIDEQIHAFNGYCLAVVQCTGDSGAINIKATSAGLKTAEVRVSAQA